MHRLHLHPDYIRSMGRKQHIIAAIMLRDFAFGMADMFVPIILLIEGYPLYWIGLFYVIQAIARILTQLTMPNLIGTLGVQNCLRISFYMGIFYIAALNYIGVSESIVVGAALYAGVMNCLYWVSRHIDTISVVSNSSTKSAQDISSIEIGTTIMRTIAPFLGGVIAEYISTQALFGVAFGILISASLVISSEAKKEKRKSYPKPDLRKAFTGRLAKAQIANFGMNFQSDLSGYIWPLFMYLAIGNLGVLGGVLSLSNVIYIGLIYTAGRSSDRIRHFFSGITIRIVTFLFRVVAASPLAVVLTDFGNSVGNGLFLTLYMDEYYSQARQSDIHANVISMELIGDFGKLAVWSLFTLLMLNVSRGTAFDLMFIAGIPMVGLTMLMLRTHK